MPRPDFIPDEQAHLYPTRRDKSGVRRDFIPDDPAAEVVAEPAARGRGKEAKASE